MDAISNAAVDTSRLLSEAFAGHTMQRIRLPDGTYRYGHVSPEVQGLFGLDADWLMAQASVDHAWIHADDRLRFVAALEASARDITPLDEEVRVMRPDGRRRWVRSLGRPRRTADGAVIWDGVALDITDRRDAEDALHRTLAEARRTEASEGRLAWIAAQGMLSPLDDLRRTIAALAARRGGCAEVDAVVSAFSAFDRAIAAAKELMGPQPVVPGDATRRLTRRQAEVVGLLHEGLSNQEIAGRLGLTEGTAKLHVSAIMKRLGARNRTEAARIAFLS